MDSYPYPIPSIWSVALQELLVTQHFVRYSTKYSYSKVSSLGFVSVFDQLFEGFPDDAEKDKIFECFVKALEEDPAQVRADAAELAAFAEGASGADALPPPVFADIKSNGEANKFAYSLRRSVSSACWSWARHRARRAEKLADAAGSTSRR